MENGLYVDKDTVERYSRQMIIPEIGVPGQLKLKSSKILIVGAGGLGCPAAQYLVSAGIGTIGLVDYDTVEVSNLHRQILHTEKAVEEKLLKVESAARVLRQMNSACTVLPISIQLSRINAAAILGEYDIIVDATDNAPSRYLINDVCVLQNKPLVSGSALRWEGQLTVYHYTDNNGTVGPCYRCLHPHPPPAESVTNCSEGGVVGVVPGIIGCMQALEVLKIITCAEPSFHEKLFVFDGLRGISRTVKLRPRQSSCVCCGDNPTIALEDLPDYTSFCGMDAGDKCQILNILKPEERISVKEYVEIRKDSASHILVDVRNPVELGICSLPNSTNIPIGRLQAMTLSHGKEEVKSLESLILNSTAVAASAEVRSTPCSVYVICRMGNDSQKAVKILKKLFSDNPEVQFKDIKGGLMAWANQIDQSMPQY